MKWEQSSSVVHIRERNQIQMLGVSLLEMNWCRLFLKKTKSIFM